MIELPVDIRGVGMFSARYPNADVWRQQAPSEVDAMPTGNQLERRTRRRASTFARAMADAYSEACSQAMLDVAQVASVFGSALGECDTMIRLLNHMWTSAEPPSPMAFAMSVHNAAAGAVSISDKNQGFVTSLAADFDTPAMALVEAAGWVHEHRGAAVVVCGDEPTPQALAQESDRWALLTCAVAIAHPDFDEGTRSRTIASIGRFSQSASTDGTEGAVMQTTQRASLTTAEARNPAAGLWDLAAAALAGEQGVVQLDRGRGSGWQAWLERSRVS